MYNKTNRWYRCAVLGILAILFIFTLLKNMGYLRLWIDGLHYFDSDVYLYKSDILDSEHFIDINLENLNENIGKVLFEDDNSKIVVSDINDNNGVYEILFRSYGSYSLDGAVLVSGIKHIKTDKGYFADLVAIAYTEYNGKVYKADISSISNLIYKDGDNFGFYIFPYAEIFEEGRYNVIIKMEGLCKNQWIRK